MFYVTLFYAAQSEDGQPYRPEFHVEGETFELAAAAARELMRRASPHDTDDARYVGPMGWPVPGVRTAKRIS